MKRLFFNLMSVLAIALFAVSCTSEKETELDNAEAAAELSFEVNLLGNPNEATKTDGAHVGICASHEELTTLAGQNNLTLNVSIKVAGAANAIDYHPKIRWTGSKFVADPILLAAGSYSTTAATITKEVGNNIVVLFSAVTSGSVYASYMPELLPKEFTVGGESGDIPLYQKTSLDLYMMCVLKETAKDFGFVKWNINFTKVYCVPFIINMCENQEHFIASGSLNIKNGTKVNGEFRPATGTESPVKLAKIDKTVNFTSTSNPLAELCFADNYNIVNDDEWYMFTLTISSPVSKTYTAYANVTTLLEYKNIAVNNAWDNRNNVIHFNFCDSKTWFFEEDIICEGVDQVEADITNHLIEYKNLEALKAIVQTQLPGGHFKDGFEGFQINEVYITIPAGTKIRFKSPIKFYADVMNFGDIYNYSSTSIGIDKPYKINIYKDQFTSKYKTVDCEYSIKSSYCNIPACFYGNTGCYYVEFEFNVTISNVISIFLWKTADNICPEQTMPM